MRHTPTHDQDHDQIASSAASLTGIDAVVLTDERAVLLDVEREAAQYGSAKPSNNGGCSYLLLSEASSTCRCKRQALFFTDHLLLCFRSFVGQKHLISQSTVAKRAKYYIPSLGWIPDYSFSLYVFHNFRCSCPDRLTVNSFGGDLLAGITVASILVPQSVSYATSLAKLSPVTGLVRGHFMLVASTEFTYWT
jgi:Sulfate permease family